MPDTYETITAVPNDENNREGTCEFCQGRVIHTATLNGTQEYECVNCHSKYYFNTRTQKLITKTLFAANADLAQIADRLIYQNRTTDMSHKQAVMLWKETAALMNGKMSNYTGIEFGVASMCYLACQTRLFTTYPKVDEDRLSAIQQVTEDSVAQWQQNGDNNRAYLMLKKWYDGWQEQRQKRRKRKLAAILITAVAMLSVLIAGSVLYRPAKADPVSGVNVAFSRDALAPTQKFFLVLHTEKLGRHTAAYTTAEKLLADSCGQFALYDISFTQFSETVKPGAPVTVTIDIPSELHDADLCIYHVGEDGLCTELPSHVSYEAHTISFETTHFSLFAVAERAYRVDFEVDGETALSEKCVLRDKPEKPADPEKTGYAFDGWFNGTDLWDFTEDMVLGDTVLSAQWRPLSYVIGFDPGEGVLTEKSRSVFYDAAVELPIPTRQNYSFDGWYDENGTLISDGIWTCPHDVQLTAHWKGLSYTVRFEADGGEGSMPMAPCTFGTAYTVPTCTFVKKGYTAIGWANAPGQTEALYPFDSDLTEPNGETEVTLYPVWVANPYTLLFISNGGQGSMDPMTVLTDETILIPDSRFARDKYVFAGWSTEADGEVVYRSGDPFVMKPGDTTLYAVWRSLKVTVQLNANGGTVQTMTVERMQEEPFGTLPTASRQGYTFAGWSFLENEYDLVTEQTAVPEKATVTLYAMWVPCENTLQFHANGGLGSMEALKVLTGQVIKLPKCLFTRDDWRFVGWSTVEDGAVIYANGAEFEITPDQLVTLYAVWQSLDAQIHFDTRGGTMDAVEMVLQKEQPYGALPTPTRIGYTFKGWYTSVDGGTSVSASTKVPNSNSIVLYARWTANQYTIMVGDQAINATYGQTVHIPIPTKEGYTFLGWTIIGAEGVDHSDERQENFINLRTTPGTVFMTANSELNGYTVSINKNDGISGTVTESYNYGDTFTLKNPTRNGYIFAGWTITGMDNIVHTYGSSTSAADVLYDVFETEFSNLREKSDLTKPQTIVQFTAYWLVDVKTIGKYVTNGTVVSDAVGNPDEAKTYTVYTSIDGTPFAPDAADGRVIVYWADEVETDMLKHTGRLEVRDGRFQNIDINHSLNEIIFVGDSLKVYRNLCMNLCYFADHQEFTIQFIDFGFVTDQFYAIKLWNDTATPNIDLTIDIVGTCSIGTSYPGGDTIILNNDSKMRFTGSGTMTVTAGNGAAGAYAGASGQNGGTGITVGELTVDMLNGTLYTYGGNGEAGRDASGNGVSGGNGGNGGVAVIATKLTISDTSNVTFVGGNGGDGRNGSDGATGRMGLASDSNMCDGQRGGDGGAGGHGGAAIIVSQIDLPYEKLARSIFISGGDGGKGGNAGKGGDGGPDIGTFYIDTPYGRNGGDGGRGGRGGDGGNGLTQVGNGGDEGNGGGQGYGIYKSWVFGAGWGQNGHPGQPGTPGNPGHKNFLIYNDHRYCLFEVTLTWEKAKVACESMGGHLVTITSKEEMENVGQLAQGYRTWIGLTNTASASGKKVFKWVTGEAYSYSNWIATQPDNFNNNEPYTHLYADGTWNDWSADIELYYICEWD